MLTSTNRLAGSVVVHGLLLAVGLLWKGSPPPAQRVVPVTLRAPMAPVPPQHPAQRTAPPARVVTRPRAFAFSAPAAVAAAAPAPLDIVLPDAVPPDAVPPDAVPMVTTPPSVPPAGPQLPGLPPPPIVVGKLGEASVVKPAASSGELRAARFSAASQEASLAPLKTVRPARFGDVATSVPDRQPASPSPTVRSTPVQILYKPTPAYTDEARRLRLEGEVVIEVLFPASGEARVLRILEGLGHGLNETAAQSVSGIRFRPAERAGETVDQVATVHIVFRLAY